MLFWAVIANIYGLRDLFWNFASYCMKQLYVPDEICSVVIMPDYSRLAINCHRQSEGIALDKVFQ